MSAVNASVAFPASASASVEAELLSWLWASAGSEIMLFLVAMLGYFALFMQRPRKGRILQAKKMKSPEQDYKEEDYPTDVSLECNNVDPQEYSKVKKALRDAYESGDYRSVLRCWNAMKKFDKVPSISLSQVVESMQRFKKETPFILRELTVFLEKLPSESAMSLVNELFESLAKRLDSDLVEKIVEMLPTINLELDARSYEALLNMYFTTRNFQEVKTLVSQMKLDNVSFTTRASMVVIKMALKLDNFDEAVQHFRILKSTWSTQSLASTPSMAPSQVVSQLVELACKGHRLKEFLLELSGITVSEEVVNAMLLECVRQRDVALAASVEKLAREQDVCFTDATYGLLIKAMPTDSTKVRSLLDEIVEKGIEITPDLADSLLASCAQTSNVQMAEQLYQHMKPQQLAALSAFVRFFADIEQFEKACDIYENDLIRLHSPAADGTASGAQCPLRLDARTERSLMSAALKCNRTHLAQTLLKSSPSDVAKHITMIRNCAAENNLDGAVSVFEALEKSGIELNSVIFNTVLDACVQCRDLGAAETWMERMKKSGMTDVVSFNTLIKACLQNGNFDKARFLMDEMKKQGLEPNRVTFNELINAIVIKGGSSQRKQMWDIVDEMQRADMKPNQVTISILLKSLNYYSGEADVSKTMALINTMEEPMDEVLLSSVVEACVRIGKPDLLKSQLKQLQNTASISISGSHTYGSLIKAYGHAHDIDGVWRCWKEMRSRHIKPTSITLGCMVEAVVSNGDTEGAFDLIHQIQSDEDCRGALNSVIYCSVLKGFAREKKMDRALSVYHEMEERQIEVSIITYNTLLDACARCGRMEYLPKLVQAMKVHHVKPNVITYSTMVKGHCLNGDIQAAFSILEEMKSDTQLKPDEIMYNSLLDGCAQNHLLDEGLNLLEQMQSEGVQPSNFTLSILVKLMNRARKLDQAFALVEEISTKYNFRPNVHVYANLVHACVANQRLEMGMSVLEKMIKEKITPDSRTYSILVRSSISKGLLDQAVGLMRGALGLADGLPFLDRPCAMCPNLDHALVSETLASLAERGRCKDLAAPLLSTIQQHAPKVRIDAATQRRVMGSVDEATQRKVNAPWNKGRSKGN